MASQSTNQSAATEQAVHVPFVPLPENDDIAADSGDSAYAESVGSGTESISSAIYNGYREHGRRYQAVREGDMGYFVPADDKQFEHMQAQHFAMFIMESQQENPFFRSNLAPGAQNVLDIGTGNADWAIAVADQHPNLTVYGVDLFPPPQTWVPPNCILEVDDITKDWTWRLKFDLVHLRLMLGALTVREWDRLYQQIYDNTAPGGWIEHVDCHNQILCDDGSLPADSYLANFHKVLGDAAAASGRVMFVTDDMKSKIAKAGFTNIKERDFKLPIGGWARHPVYKDAGRYMTQSMLDGFEGWVMFLLTKFGEPKPWSEEEVKVYVENLKRELEQGYHIYQVYKRVWAQKSFDAPKVEKEEVV